MLSMPLIAAKGGGMTLEEEEQETGFSTKAGQLQVNKRVVDRQDEAC